MARFTHRRFMLFGVLLAGILMAGLLNPASAEAATVKRKLPSGAVVSVERISSLQWRIVVRPATTFRFTKPYTNQQKVGFARLDVVKHASTEAGIYIRISPVKANGALDTARKNASGTFEFSFTHAKVRLVYLDHVKVIINKGQPHAVEIL
jgi:hypothetical protein